MASELVSQLSAFSLRLPERPLEEHNIDDLDSIIRSLTGLRLASPRQATVSPAQAMAVAAPPAVPAEAAAAAADWAELCVREMASASDRDDAKARASTLLEGFENSLHERNLGLKQRAEENAILKRAVVVQFRRQKELEEELRRVKQAASQYQEQLRALELNNYALAVHLKQANQSNGSISGRFPPDVC